MLNVGIVGGAGVMGKMHTNCYRQLANVRIAGIADLREKEGREAAEGAAAQWYPTLDAMLSAEKPDIVDVCLPTYLHGDAVIAAAQAGTHVLCEKPVALHLAECDRMLEAVSRAGVKFMVAQVIRFWPEYQVLTDAVRTGKYGKVLMAKFTRLGSTPKWSWDDWMRDPERSGSAALDLHIHDVDYIHHILGKPEAVYSIGRKSRIGWGNVTTIYEYPGRSQVFAQGGVGHAQKDPFRMQFTVLFEDGALEYDNQAWPTLLLYRPGQDPAPVEIPRPAGADESEVGGNVSSLGGYYNEIRYFVECVERDRPVDRVTHADIRGTLAIVLAEVESLETGQRVEVG